MILLRTLSALLLTLLFACSSDAPVERSCYTSGHTAAPTCNYEISELSNSPEAEGVRLSAYLHERKGELYLAEDRDGTGATVRIAQVPGRNMDDVIWMAGHRVGIRGIFHHEINSLDVYSIGWIDEPGVPEPIPPFPGPSGVSRPMEPGQTDRKRVQADTEVARQSADDEFFYFTHDANGARICSEISYTPEERCHYLLDELTNIREPSVVGVRLYGFLVSRNDNLYIATSRSGTGTAMPVTQVDDIVPQWLVGRLVETEHLAGLNGQYFPETKTIRAFSLSYVNLPGETPFRIPPPDQR